MMLFLVSYYVAKGNLDCERTNYRLQTIGLPMCALEPVGPGYRSLAFVVDILAAAA
jgi:hypothetical protein